MTEKRRACLFLHCGGFTTVLVMGLGPNLTIAGEHAQATEAIARHDMIEAFLYVFESAAAMLALAAFFLVLMEERPLAGPAREEARAVVAE